MPDFRGRAARTTAPPTARPRSCATTAMRASATASRPRRTVGEPSIASFTRTSRAVTIARMDHDDWSRSDRLERQAGYPRHGHPRTVLVGSWAEIMDERGRVISSLASRSPPRHPRGDAVHQSDRARLGDGAPVPSSNTVRIPTTPRTSTSGSGCARARAGRPAVPLYRWRSNPAGISRLRAAGRASAQPGHSALASTGTSRVLPSWRRGRRRPGGRGGGDGSGRRS
jgi:hypothetical protein